MTNLCLSVRQPYASALVRLIGHKNIENRTRPTHVRGRIAVHSSMKLHDNATPEDERLPRGAIVGTVQIIGCHQAGSDECHIAGCASNYWAEFPTRDAELFHWEIGRPREFVTPIKAKGALGFWRPGPSIDYLISFAELTTDTLERQTTDEQQSP